MLFELKVRKPFDPALMRRCELTSRVNLARTMIGRVRAFVTGDCGWRMRLVLDNLFCM
jgi:hypothetical protein